MKIVFKIKISGSIIGGIRGVLSLFVGLVACSSIAACSDEQATYNLDGGDLVTVGQIYVSQRGCPTCHQSANAADGVLSGNFAALPGSTPHLDMGPLPICQPYKSPTELYAPNLTPDIDTGLGAWADIEIVRAMRFGVRNNQLMLCPVMPRASGADGGTALMTDLEADAIVAYLRSLPAVSRHSPTSYCPNLNFHPPPDMTGWPDCDPSPDMYGVDMDPPPDLSPLPDGGNLDAGVAVDLSASVIDMGQAGDN